MFNQSKFSWESQVGLALEQVSNGQHLRFISYCFRTVDVCTAALLHETSHNPRPFDIREVPAGIIDEVVAKVKKITNDRVGQNMNAVSRLSRECHNEVIFEYLDKEASLVKEESIKPGYYSFGSLEAQMKHYKASTFDEMLKAMYETPRNK
jgi:hypothetical protein